MKPDGLFWIVFLSAAGITGWLYFYAKVWLPKHLDERLQESVKAFSTAVELRFPSHAGLSARVEKLSVRVGRQLGLNENQLRDLSLAATLRDVGLCSIPYALVNHRPVNTWSSADFSTYFQHAKIGSAMLEMIPSLRRLAPVVAQHHEPYDSKDGLPNRHARILHVVTDYLWVERRQGDFLARKHLKDLSGTEFDPEVVQALLAVLTSNPDVKEREAAIPAL
ncbi:MAG: hypothetical protein JSS72_01275 [Armatimonadetes bacterium]|nr:hypothetical protein [Armatimonadota bacterium]